MHAQCDLAYATTPHAAQGRTVDTSHVLVDGLGDRQGLYVAMSRGQEANYAYCVTGFPRAADIREGSQPAAELERMRRLAMERAGLDPGAEPAGQAATPEPRRDPVAVLADVLRRDGTVLSATETLRRELADADHLGVLGSIWYDLTRRAQAARFQQALQAALPAPEADAALLDPASTWLWRTLREAEAAGLDAGQVLEEALREGSLAGARDVVRVIDARVRRRLAGTVPQPPGSWSQRVPDVADPELRRYLSELAAAMDDRVSRIGEHAAQVRAAWAVQALGEPPQDPAERAVWEGRAATIGAYRELYGYGSQADAIGPEPGKTSPEARADWHCAFAALGRVEGIDLRGLTDDQLYLRRGMYERETSWAPPHVSEELRLARLQVRTAWENAIRARHEAGAAETTAAAERHQSVAAMWQAMESKASQVAEHLAEVQETRQQWAALTEPTRRMAVAADLELRRRHPDMALEPLKSAEPAGITLTAPGSALRDDALVEETLFGVPWTPEPDAGLEEVVRDADLETRREAAGQQALGLTAEAVDDDIPATILRIRENARNAQEDIDRLRGMPQFAEDDDATYLGNAWGSFADHDREAIIQPPKPEMLPAREIVERAHGVSATHESGHA